MDAATSICGPYQCEKKKKGNLVSRRERNDRKGENANPPQSEKKEKNRPVIFNSSTQTCGEENKKGVRKSLLCTYAERREKVAGGKRKKEPDFRLRKYKKKE